jgi:hypothetical protein
MFWNLLALNYGEEGSLIIDRIESNNHVIINRGKEDGINASHMSLFDEKGFLVRLFCYASMKNESLCKAYHTVRWNELRFRTKYMYKSIQQMPVISGAMIQEAFLF